MGFGSGKIHYEVECRSICNTDLLLPAGHLMVFVVCISLILCIVNLCYSTSSIGVDRSCVKVLFH